MIKANAECSGNWYHEYANIMQLIILIIIRQKHVVSMCKECDMYSLDIGPSQNPNFRCVVSVELCKHKAFPLVEFTLYNSTERPSLTVTPLWQCSKPIDKTPVGGQGASSNHSMIWYLHHILLTSH